VAGKPTVGDLRVQQIERGDGGGLTIRVAGGGGPGDADGSCRGYEGSGTQRTYAYLLVDHLRWLEREAPGARVGRVAGSERTWDRRR